MKIIVGLGNVGEKYQDTRHNVGFYAIDHFLYKNQIIPEWKEEKKLKAYTMKSTFKGQIIYLVKPTTFMNLSGQAVQAILNFFKEPVENVVVIYDDIDLEIGKIRVRDQGSAGTHNGMKSMIQELGTDQIKRIRIGIESRGTISPAQQDLASFVLSRFTSEEIPLIEEAFEQSSLELENLISA